MPFVIGLVGEKGSGKGTFAAFFEDAAEERRVVSHRFSSLLAKTLDDWSIQRTRANLQTLAVVMDQGFGVGTLSNAVFNVVSKADADIVVLDGVRWDTDMGLIRRFPKNLLIYITANTRLRYERTLSRGEKADEASVSFEQFLEEEQAANELGIPRIGALSDDIIKNEGTIEDLREAAIRCYRMHCI